LILVGHKKRAGRYVALALGAMFLLVHAWEPDEATCGCLGGVAGEEYFGMVSAIIGVVGGWLGFDSRVGASRTSPSALAAIAACSLAVLMLTLRGATTRDLRGRVEETVGAQDVLVVLADDKCHRCYPTVIQASEVESGPVCVVEVGGATAKEWPSGVRRLALSRSEWILMSGTGKAGAWWLTGGRWIRLW
jgi:hypothetical protein